MIIENNIKIYEPIVLDAIDELFKHCMSNEFRPNDFLIFLENGHHEPNQFRSK